MTRAEAKLVLDSLTTWEGEERMITAEIVEAIRVLSQEPHLSNDLEEAAEEYRRESYSKSVLPNIDGPMPEYGGGIKDAFIAGAEWQKSQMLKDVVEYKIVNNLAAYPVIYYEVNHLGLKYGDKVRLIVLKEEEG